LASTTSLEGAYLLLVDLSARHSSHGVGNFDERPWGVSMSVTRKGASAASATAFAVIESSIGSSTSAMRKEGGHETDAACGRSLCQGRSLWTQPQRVEVMGFPFL
jgi:hypothetical protein